MRVQLKRTMMVAIVLALVAPRTASAQGGEIRTGFGVHASYPEYLSVSLTAATGIERMDGSRQGFVLLAEPGLNGGRLLIGNERGLGLGTMTNSFGILQTWNKPPGTVPNITYLDTETRLQLNWLVVGIGFGFRIAGGASTSGLLFSSTAAPIIVTGLIGGHVEF